MDDGERKHMVIFEDGEVRSFRSVSFHPDCILADGRVLPYSEVDEVHLADH